MALDSGAGRLYLPEGNRIQVLDLEGRGLGVVSDLPGIQGVGLAPELGIGFAGMGRANTVAVFNLATLEVEKRMRTTGGEPGALLFDPATRRIFAFNERGRNATAFDAFGGAVAGSVPLGGSPGPAVGDGAGRLYASLEDPGAIVVLDARRLAVIQRWPLTEVERPVGLALDPGRHRLFVAGGDGRLAILDSRSGALKSVLAFGAPLAGLACDAGAGRVYLVTGEGVLGVVPPEGGDPFSPGNRIETPTGVRAMALDPASHRLYLPYAQIEGRAIKSDSSSLVVPIRICGENEGSVYDGKRSVLAK
jgi:hypothetical protein